MEQDSPVINAEREEEGADHQGRDIRDSAIICLLLKLVISDQEQHDHFCLGESCVPRLCP